MSNLTNQPRIRFAPSPTGSPHIGSVWQALLEWLACKSRNGTFILRIEDTDRSRYVEPAESEIFSALDWLGLTIDESPLGGGQVGPYRQSERLNIYREHADKLVQKGAAYYCFCTSERLEQLRTEQQANNQATRYDRKCLQLDQEDIETKLFKEEPYVLRLKVPLPGETSFDDIIRGKISFLNETIDDQVLVKSDGWPTYHLASVVDDHLMGIKDVIRGEEWLSSTPKHILLYQAFGWDIPNFAHLPLILGNDKAKLSKRHGSAHLSQFIKDGYLPEAMINFLSLLGWNPKTEEEIFSLEELVQRFKLEDVNKSGAIFNHEKLDWFNAHYIKKLSVNELYQRSVEFVDYSKYNESQAKRALQVVQDRLVKLSELPEQIDSILNLPNYEGDILIWKKSTKEGAKEALTRMYGLIENMVLEEVDQIDKEIKAYMTDYGMIVGDTLWPLRVALSGRKNSPNPFELLWVLGKEISLSRIEEAINKLK
jgi:glutamyl-tRNA synthetase